MNTFVYSRSYFVCYPFNIKGLRSFCVFFTETTIFPELHHFTQFWCIILHGVHCFDTFFSAISTVNRPFRKPRKNYPFYLKTSFDKIGKLLRSRKRGYCSPIKEGVKGHQIAYLATKAHFGQNRQTSAIQEMGLYCTVPLPTFQRSFASLWFVFYRKTQRSQRTQKKMFIY